MRSSKVNDRDVTMFFAFLRTARAVAVDFGLIPAILEKVQQFVRSPGDRTKDVISNLLTLIGYMLVLDASDMAKLDLPCFVRALMAETVRRAAGDVFHGRSDTTVLELINRLVHGIGGKKGAAAAAAQPLPSSEAARMLLEPVEVGKPATNLANVAFDPKAHLSIPKTAPIAGQVTDVTDGGSGGDSSSDSPAAAAAAATAAGSALEGEDNRDVAGQLRLHKQVLKGLAVHGMAQGGAVPGPNIETKTAAAAKVAEEWWAGLMTGEGAPQVGGAGGRGDGDAFNPDDINCGTVSILRDIEAEITPRLRPTLATLSMFHELIKFWFAANQTANVWEVLDSNSGLPPRAWIDSVKACSRQEAGLFATMTALLPSDDNPVQTLRAIVLQAVAFHRNKDARLASASGDYIDVVDTETARKAILKQHKDIAERQQKAMEDIEQ